MALGIRAGADAVAARLAGGSGPEGATAGKPDCYMGFCGSVVLLAPTL